jgi:hypothetical protein
MFVSVAVTVTVYGVDIWAQLAASDLWNLFHPWAKQ